MLMSQTLVVLNYLNEIFEISFHQMLLVVGLLIFVPL